jgi:tetratricopeptide (TPR) repeat protein
MKQFVFASILIFAAILFTFHSAADGLFLNWDDDIYIVNNPRAQSLGLENVLWFFTHPYFASYTPLAMLSHGLDWTLWGNNPRAHHWVSLIVHGLNCIMVFWAGVFLLNRNRRPLAKKSSAGSDQPISPALVGAFASALLFGVHPLRVESVAWISDRKDLLAAMFSLVSLLAYLQADSAAEARLRKGWATVSVLSYACALMSKVLTIPLPAVFLLLDLTVIHPTDWRKRLWHVVAGKLPYLIPAAGIGIGALLAVGSADAQLNLESASWFQRIVFPFFAPWFYLVKLFIPSTLSPAYHIRINGTLAITAIPVILLTLGTVWLANRGRPAPLGAWLSYLILLSPTFLFLSPWIQSIADRHSYLSTIPLTLLAGGGFMILWEESYKITQGRIVRATSGTICILLALWYGLLSERQIRVWHNSISLWTQAVTVAPEHPLAYANLGAAVASTGNFQDAAAFYRYAIRLEPRYAPGWYNLGIIYASRGILDSAEACYRKGILGDPLYLRSYRGLGEVLGAQRRWSDAQTIYRQLRARAPNEERTWTALGRAFFALQDIDSARTCYERAVALDSSSGEAHWGLAKVRAAEGKADEAEVEIKAAKRFGYEGVTESGKEQTTGRPE